VRTARPKHAFLSRGSFLRVLGVDAEAWAKRYGITPFTAPCSACGGPCTTSIPFFAAGFRGLMSPPCACGVTRTPYALVRDDGGEVLR
jgi:hypothetical protein